VLLARVVGPVWGTRHAEGLNGRKVLELRTLQGGRLCAVDALGAGPGEWVLVAHGSRVRDLTVGAQVAEKDIIIAIVDGVDSPGAPLELTEDDAARARRRAGERERR
jgi:microcompartment protein CcmK/EutM